MQGKIKDGIPKQRVLLLIMILVLCLFTMACNKNRENHEILSNNSEDSMDNSEDSTDNSEDSTDNIHNEDSITITPSPTPILEDEKVLNEITGTVYDGTMETITIITMEGDILEFDKSESQIMTTEEGARIGYPITLYYEGELDKNARAQKVKVKEIVIEDYSELTPEEQAYHMTVVLSLEEKVGQMFIARAPVANASEKVEEYKIGGYILFKQDFEGNSKDQVIENIKSYQNASTIPMFIAVDEEGGTVNRVSGYTEFREEPFQSPQELYSEGGWQAILDDTTEKCDLLRELGINVNFAPVADVSTNPDDFIYQRSFGKEAMLTSQYVETVVSAMKDNSMGSVLKHFPGYGNNEDTHVGIAYDHRSYETFETSDFIPFQGGIEAGANAVLVSHNIVSSMDSQHPASLSPKVHKILREDLKFDGVVVTDDLSMEAIRQFAEVDEVAVMAVLAGNDLLCCTDFEEQIPAVINAVKAGDITIDRINESVIRILTMKIELGLL